MAEHLLLSEVMVFTVLIKVNGLLGPNSQLRLKGHCIAFPHDAATRAATYVRELPRQDLPNFFKVTLLGPAAIMELFKRTVKERLGFLKARAPVVIQWLNALREVRAHLGRPWPSGGDEQRALDEQALQQLFDRQFDRLCDEVECVTDEVAIALEARECADIAASVDDPHADDFARAATSAVDAGVGAGQELHLPWIQLSTGGAQIPEDATAMVLGMVQSAVASTADVSAAGLGQGSDCLPPAAGGDDEADQAAVDQGHHLHGGSSQSPPAAASEDVDGWLRRELAASGHDETDDLETAGSDEEWGDTNGSEFDLEESSDNHGSEYDVEEWGEYNAMGDFGGLLGGGGDGHAVAEELVQNDEAGESDGAMESELQGDDGSSVAAPAAVPIVPSQRPAIVPVGVRLRSVPVNEYTGNDTLLAGAFPALFPLGLTADMLGGAGPLRPDVVRRLLTFYDPRFARDKQFLFLLNNQQVRNENALAATLRVKGKSANSATSRRFVALVNQPDFLARLAAAVKNPESADAKKIAAAVVPLIRVASSQSKWTSSERSQAMPKMLALSHTFGLPCWFTTFAPLASDQPMFLRFCHAKREL